MKFIGIDVHKRIYTACILDDSEKLVGELNDIPTTLEGLQKLTKLYPPEDCFIVFENLGRAHFVKRVLNDMGYSLEVAHTGHGAMQQIASANLKTDSIDAYKLALVAKDLWMGRRYIRTAHLSSDENMRTKALCRIVAECAEIRDEMNLRIKEYIALHNI